MVAARDARRASAAAATVRPRVRNARHVLGSFQFSILVRTKEEILPGIERTVHNLRRVIGTVPVENRWHPVLQRYLRQVMTRVTALGGARPEPTPRLQPGPVPEPVPRPRPREETVRLEGKIAGIRYDRFGDFEGFVLDTEDGLREFFSREREMETLVGRAWHQRITVLVIAEREKAHQPLSVMFLRAPSDD
jgi:hypothetical protein